MRRRSRGVVMPRSPSLSPSGTLEHRLLSKAGMAATAGLATQDGGARQGTTEPRVALDDVSRRDEALRHRAAEQDARHLGTPLLTDRSVPDHHGWSYAIRGTPDVFRCTFRGLATTPQGRCRSADAAGFQDQNGRGPGTLRHRACVRRDAFVGVAFWHHAASGEVVARSFLGRRLPPRFQPGRPWRRPVIRRNAQ